MSSENATKAGGKAVTSYLNLSSRYERKARLLPGLICAMTLLPVGAFAYGTPQPGHWISLMATGAGLCGPSAALPFPHLSVHRGQSVSGEDSWATLAPTTRPTNLWLHPEDRTVSTQQKKQVNEAVKRLIKLDIEAAVEQGPRRGRGRVE